MKKLIIALAACLSLAQPMSADAINFNSLSNVDAIVDQQVIDGYSFISHESGMIDDGTQSKEANNSSMYLKLYKARVEFGSTTPFTLESFDLAAYKIRVVSKIRRFVVSRLSV